MSKFTPGPWRFQPAGDTGRYCDPGADQGGFYAVDGKCVCWFGDDTTYYPSGGCAPDEADARLIAAAPELLLALEFMVDRFGARRDLLFSQRVAIKKAREAIAKARGE